MNIKKNDSKATVYIHIIISTENWMKGLKIHNLLEN